MCSNFVIITKLSGLQNSYVSMSRSTCRALSRLAHFQIRTLPSSQFCLRNSSDLGSFPRILITVNERSYERIPISIQELDKYLRRHLLKFAAVAEFPSIVCAAGGVAERLIAPVLKTGRPKGLVSSNLTPSASNFRLVVDKNA